jgi:hypothetical protein
MRGHAILIMAMVMLSAIARPHEHDFPTEAHRADAGREHSLTVIRSVMLPLLEKAALDPDETTPRPGHRGRPKLAGRSRRRQPSSRDAKDLAQLAVLRVGIHW